MSAVAKRMLLHYQRGAFPAYEEADEGGMPQPCALGLPWVNPDTLRTLAECPLDCDRLRTLVPQRNVAQCQKLRQ